MSLVCSDIHRGAGGRGLAEWIDGFTFLLGILLSDTKELQQLLESHPPASGSSHKMHLWEGGQCAEEEEGFSFSRRGGAEGSGAG